VASQVPARQTDQSLWDTCVAIRQPAHSHDASEFAAQGACPWVSDLLTLTKSAISEAMWRSGNDNSDDTRMVYIICTPGIVSVWYVSGRTL
jgi:hypothetical protein